MRLALPVSMSVVFFASICTLSRVLFYAGVRLVPFFMFW